MSEAKTYAPPTLLARNITKSYPLPQGRLDILRDVSLMASEGEAIAIMGVSGCGKTTLLNILAGIDTANSGEVTLSGGRAGLIFQLHYLLPELDALENVSLAARLAGLSKSAALSKSEDLLREVGLSERLHHLPSELSGGEAARVAIARALAPDHEVILADEPTGNLDEDTSESVQQLLFRTVREHARTMIIVTHDSRVAARADRVLKLEHGILK